MSKRKRQARRARPACRPPTSSPSATWASAPVLEARHLGIDFGGLTAVDDFNLTIGRTEIAGLIGPNGAGKTTIFNLLTNVYQPTRGTVLSTARTPPARPPFRSTSMGIARTFQNIRLFRQPVGGGQRADRPAQPCSTACWPACFRLPSYLEAGARPTTRRWNCCPSSTCGVGGRQGRQPALRRPAAPGDRARAGHRPQGAAAGRARGRHEPRRDRGAHGEHPQHPRQFQIAILLIEHDMSLVMGICEGIGVLNYGQHHRQGHARGDSERIPRSSRPIWASRGELTWRTPCSQFVTHARLLRGHQRRARASPSRSSEGEIVTLIGANGAGKSTTLNTVAGLHQARHRLHQPSRAEIVGVPSHKVVALGMALCPEGRRVFSQMSVAREPGHGRLHPLRRREPPALERRLRALPPPEGAQGQVAGTLSGGEQQMLAMGRALMSKPDLLMLDEPSMGLAPILVEQIFDIIKELNAAGHHHPAGRAERQHGALHCRPRLRA